MAKKVVDTLEGYVEVIGVDTSIAENKSLSASEKTKKNFETLMQPCGVLEADFALQQQFNAYACSQLETVTNRIKQCVYNISSNFIEIGFRLWECERYKYYVEMGFNSVCDYALSELGFKKSSTRNFIRVYERFCNHEIVQKASHGSGPSLSVSGDAFGKHFLLFEYKNFTYSQLTELLSLSDEQIRIISPTPEDTVKSIRDKKQEFHEASERWLHDAIIEAVGGKLGFKKQIYDHYMENKSVGKLATFIRDHMMKIKIGSTSGVLLFDDGSYCRFNLSKITFYHSLYFPEDKVFRWYDLAEKIVGYIEADTFMSEQIHIDEIAEEISEEMVLTAPENVVDLSDRQRCYKIELYKDDVDIILKCLRTADIPQEDYERIYETIGKAEFL